MRSCVMNEMVVLRRSGIKKLWFMSLAKSWPVLRAGMLIWLKEFVTLKARWPYLRLVSFNLRKS